MVNVLFVCLGNICRSPSAEGVFRSLVRGRGLEQLIGIDSAGTHGYHIGKAPDPRAVAAARRRGVDLSDLRVRQAVPDDFRRFDYVIAMDRSNLDDLAAICPAGATSHLHLLLEFAPETGRRDVPDPYYDGHAAFEAMFDLIEAGAAGLLAHIERSHALS